MRIGNVAHTVRLLSLILLFWFPCAFAFTYELPDSGTAVIGKTQYVTTEDGDTLITLAQRYDIGINTLEEANPDIAHNRPMPSGRQIALPAAYVLPQLPQKGIVINLPEMRLYYFTGDGMVRTYPIGIGKVGKTIPIKRTKVIRKMKDPVWIPPEDIRAFNENQGIILPTVMPAGPDNPLGPYAIYLQIPTYLIHSTIFPESVGRRASFGCIRMHENDIKDIFPIVTAGTPVTIVDMPTKVGWVGNSLFMENHAPLEEHADDYQASYDGIVKQVQQTAGNRLVFVDWQMVKEISESHDGIPHDIGFTLH